MAARSSICRSCNDAINIGKDMLKGAAETDDPTVRSQKLKPLIASMVDICDFMSTSAEIANCTLKCAELKSRLLHYAQSGFSEMVGEHQSASKQWVNYPLTVSLTSCSTLFGLDFCDSSSEVPEAAHAHMKELKRVGQAMSAGRKLLSLRARRKGVIVPHEERPKVDSKMSLKDATDSNEALMSVCL
jgi:hypothetical protein